MNFRKHCFLIGAAVLTVFIVIVALLINGQNSDADKKGVLISGYQGDKNDNMKQVSNINAAEPFEIYMVQENVENNLELNGLPLDDKPVIGGEQLIAYYWDAHILKVKAGEYLEKIRKYTPVSGRPFVLVSNGKRLYKGYFWTSLSSVSFPATPLIDIEGVPNEEELYIQRERDEVLLQLVLSPNMKNRQDLLNQIELFNALKESGKLVESSTPPEDAEKAYRIDMSGTEKVTIEQDEKVIYTIKETAELKNFSSYLDNMTLLPNDNKIRVNRSSIIKFRLWNKDGTTVSYDTVYDSLYDLGYIDINGLKVRADLDFFRLLESYPRYPGSSYDVPEDVVSLFENYGWTVSFKVNEMKEKLPSDLKYQAGEFPVKIYWAYNFALAKAIGSGDLNQYLGRTVDIEIYRLNEGLPEEFEPNIEARGVVIRSQGKIIGAYMNRGRHSSFACSLDRKTLEQITGKSWAEWLDSYIDFDNKLLKELSVMTPEEVIKTSFDALDKGDYKRYYATFTIKRLVSYLSGNMDFSDLYNKGFPESNINKAKLLNIGNSRDEINYKMYPVEIDFDFKRMITSDDGPQPRFVGIEKESENIGWRISGIGTGP
ncbi:MAG TPA: DUF4829 domain-containing protein [Clostridia bacterium]|nr:DUF4829 domain-containing protein [Clostridia bacterium]